MKRLLSLVLATALTVGFLGYIQAQQGGQGVPGGAAFSTQYQLNAVTFGGAGPGTAGQVLTSNGAALAPTFQAASSGGSTIPTTVQGDTLYASATNVMSALAKNTSATRYLANTGTNNNPAWAQVALATGVSGTLPVANGGTNLTAAADDNVMVGNATTWETKAVPNCTDTTGQHLNYTASSNSFSCGTSGTSPSLATTAMFVDDFYFIQGVADGVLTTDPVGNWTPAVGGVGDIELVTSGTILAGHPAVVRVNTGTGTSDNAGMVLSNGLSANPGSPNYILHATNQTRVDCVIWIPVLPDGTQTYVASCGLARLAIQSTVDNLVLAQVIWNGSAVRWNLKSSVSGGSSTSTAASTGPSATTWYQVTLIMTTATVTMFVDGVQVATHSTNIPTANMGGHISVEKTAGTTARDMDVDLYVSQQAIANRLPGGI